MQKYTDWDGWGGRELYCGQEGGGRNILGFDFVHQRFSGGFCSDGLCSRLFDFWGSTGLI